MHRREKCCLTERDVIHTAGGKIVFVPPSRLGSCEQNPGDALLPSHRLHQPKLHPPMLFKTAIFHRPLSKHKQPLSRSLADLLAQATTTIPNREFRYAVFKKVASSADLEQSLCELLR